MPDQQVQIVRKTHGRFSIKKGFFATMLTLLLLGGVVSLFSLSTADPTVRQQATQNRSGLERTVQYAKSIGVPHANLQPILAQEQALDATHAPFSLFNNTSATIYYRNISLRYQQLTITTRGLIQVSTEQLAQQTQN